MTLKYETFLDSFYGSLSYYRYGARHRDHNKPAVIWSDGDIFWYQYNSLHRDDGYAMRRGPYGVEYYLRGTCHTREEYDFKIRNT